LASPRLHHVHETVDSFRGEALPGGTLGRRHLDANRLRLRRRRTTHGCATSPVVALNRVASSTRAVSTTSSARTGTSPSPRTAAANANANAG
jgi:hypothetical protein